jgi:hypothetical protein
MKEYKVKVYDNRTEWYNLDGERHREDAPAVEYSNGSKAWYINNQRHREDGPAIEYDNGTKFWYINDKLHREDGPAAEWANGDKFWYLNDKELTKKEFKKRMNPKSCLGKIVEIDGKKYKLTEL